MARNGENNKACSAGTSVEHTLRPDAALAARRRRTCNIAVFLVVALAWVLLDVATKRHFNAFVPGELVGGPYAGIFQLRLVHNTGAAWGIFDDATFALGVFSLVVCGVVLAYALASAKSSSPLLTGALALVFAGGVGNALDRFTLGYVVDFIEPVFIDFPVFNVADIGVTCGIVLVLVALLWEWRHAEDTAGNDSREGGERA
ncbi:MAG: signal peptidase II [Eggerthellaceae bacterium]|nr:signal peptidase II [Eggerthellaceae bacterium]